MKGTISTQPLMRLDSKRSERKRRTARGTKTERKVTGPRLRRRGTNQPVGAIYDKHRKAAFKASSLSGTQALRSKALGETFSTAAEENAVRGKERFRWSRGTPLQTRKNPA